MKKKILAWLLCAVMVLTIAPLPAAYAADFEEDVESFVLTDEGDSTFIESLVAEGCDSLYDALIYLRNNIGAGAPSALTDRMDDLIAELDSLDGAGEVFTADLSDFTGGNSPVGINADGTFIRANFAASDYHSHAGFSTYDGNVNYTYPLDYTQNGIDMGSNLIDMGGGVTKEVNYIAFGIAWVKMEPTTFVLSNEEGGLIDQLIAGGYGNSSLYEGLVALEPASGGVISESFLDILAENPGGSAIFTQTLNSYAGLNGGVAINTDGTVFTTTSIKGRDYHGGTGYSTYPDGYEGREMFTYTDSAAYYIDAESGGTTYKVFAIGWSLNQVPTFMLSNEESGLIDQLIAAGHGNDTLYEVMQLLQPVSGGAIPADYMAALDARPADCEAKTAVLSNFSSEFNNPIGIGADGNLIVAQVHGRDYYDNADFTTTRGTVAGAGIVQFTAPDSESDYVDAGALVLGGVTYYYKTFAIGWSMNQPTTFVLSNEEGGLIDQLIAAGYGNSNLFQALASIRSASNGVISEDFMETLALNDSGSQIFTQKLNDYAGLNGGVAINTNGTAFTTTSIKGRDYHGGTGYSTYPDGYEGREMFTYTDSAAYYIDAESGGTTFKVFAIGWSASAFAVKTSDIIDLTATSALILGEVTGDDSSDVTARGVVYATAPDPALPTGTAVPAATAGIGEFNAALTGLYPNTTYYVRAYATNAGGTAYGASRNFRTPVSVTTVTVGSMPKQPTVNRVTNKIYVPNNFGYSVTVIDGATDAVITTISTGAGASPYFAAVNETTNKIYIANSNTVSVIDGATDTVTATVPVGIAPRAIAINETTNTVYVANYMASTVTVINGATDTVNATWDIGANTRPTHLAVNEKTNKLYTANYWNNTISVIDCATGVADAIIPASSEQNSPRFVAVNEQTNKIYVANFRSANVTVIDGTNNSYTHVTVGVDPWEIAVNEVTNKIYISTDGETTVSVLDGATNTVQTTIAGKAPQAVGINTMTNMIYVGNYNHDDRSDAGFVVTQIHGTTLESVGFADASNPSFITVNDLTNKVYVVNFNQTVTIIALAQDPALTVAGTAADDTAILQIDNKTPSARDKTWEISVTSGTVKAGVAKADVTLSGLPAGLDYTAAKGTGNTIVITLTGAATTALTADATVTATIKGSAVTETDAQDSAGISLDLWYVGEGTTIVITNENGLIDKLITAGHGTKNLYQVMQLLQPISNGVITDRFMKTLASAPVDRDAFDSTNCPLSVFASINNNPICINVNGTLEVNAIYGRDYYEDADFTTTTGNIAGVGNILFTAADSSDDFIDAGSSGTLPEGTVHYYAVAIVWMPTLPAVTTDTVNTSGVTLSSAAVSGNVTSAGTASVTERGFVYGATANPTTSDTKVTASLGTGTGDFSATLTSLAAATTYHVRAYAISGAGTAYGADVSFTTLSGGGGGTDDDPPTVVTNAVTGITASAATLNGNVTASGGASVTERGFVYGASTNPTTSDTKVTAALGTGTGAFSATLSGLTAASTYHVRAYAISDAGTSYGQDRSFTTASSSGGGGGGSTPKLPAVATGTASSLSAHTAVLNGQITSRDGAAITGYGFSYKTSEGEWTQAQVGADDLLGSFRYSLSGLTPGTEYSFKAWATNSKGTAYGTERSFKTPQEKEETQTDRVEPSDLTGHWSYNCTLALFEHGIITGYPDGSISPDQEITRAEAAVLLVSTLGLQDYQPQSQTKPYLDELPSWAGKAILTATEKKLMKGYPGGTFLPGQKITRAEMCVALVNAFPMNAPDGFELEFSDAADIPDWARASIEAALANNVVSGYPDKSFQPTGNIKRGEAFSMICRLKGFHQDHNA